MLRLRDVGGGCAGRALPPNPHAPIGDEHLRHVPSSVPYAPRSRCPSPRSSARPPRPSRTLALSPARREAGGTDGWKRHQTGPTRRQKRGLLARNKAKIGGEGRLNLQPRSPTWWRGAWEGASATPQTRGTESPSQPSHPPPSHTSPSQASKDQREGACGEVGRDRKFARKLIDLVAGPRCHTEPAVHSSLIAKLIDTDNLEIYCSTTVLQQPSAPVQCFHSQHPASHLLLVIYCITKYTQELNCLPPRTPAGIHSSASASLISS
jgi:hypothetical protein